MATIVSRGKAIPKKKLAVVSMTPQPSLNERQKKQVKRLIGITQEQNAIDTNILTTVDAGGQVVRIVHPAQGDGVSERTGDEVELRRIRMRL